MWYIVGMNDIKLVYQNSGSWWCVGIYSVSSDEEAMEAQYNSFWNHGATSTEPKKATDSLWYFWTTPKAFRKALESAELFKLLNEGEESNCFKGCEGGAMPYAKANAQSRIDAMEHENFFSPRSKYVRPYFEDGFSVGTISAEKPDSYSNDKN